MNTIGIADFVALFVVALFALAVTLAALAFVVVIIHGWWNEQAADSWKGFREGVIVIWIVALIVWAIWHTIEMASL